MFNDIGGKIKELAYIICVLGIVASVIIAIVLFGQNSHYNPTAGVAFAVLIGGCAGSWFSGFFIYGFGELIDQQATIVFYLETLDKETKNSSDSAQKDESGKATIISAWECPECGQRNSVGQISCVGCGRYK